MRKTTHLAAAFVLAASLLAADASAGEATDVVKAKQTQLFETVKQSKSDAQQTKLRQLFDEMLAYDVFAKDSLGEEWHKRSDAEKGEFQGILTDLVRNNYKRNLAKMLDYNIEYVGEEASDGTILVKTTASHKTDKREPKIEIDFRLARINGKLKVVDIVTERASLVKTYRSQFLRILKKDGFTTLIEKMKKKLVEA